jgi:hypothetical protein
VTVSAASPLESPALDLSAARPPRHPPLQHLPAPCAEPPYDDERDAQEPRRLAPREQALVVQGTLALSFLLPSGAPAAPQSAPLLRLVSHDVAGGREGTEAQDTEDVGDFGPQPTASASLPAARTWAGRVVQAIVEVLAGARPVGQLVRWTSAEVYDEIANLVVPGPQLPCGPLRGVVRSVHVTEPADGVAEVCALVRRGARSTAVALRLEGRDGRWQCTALELG